MLNFSLVPKLFLIIWAIFVILYAGHFRLRATVACAHCAISLPELAQIHFRITGTHLWHHKRVTLRSISDYTLCEHSSFAYRGLRFGHICYFTCGPLQAYIHFVWAIRRPAVPYHCLKWATSGCYLGWWLFLHESTQI